MIELAKHIEILLLEHDCVIVPDLGGFIAHYLPARYEEAEGLFLPPVRTVGFNPQLTMNDGLLTQSYMQAYHTDFPDAARKIAAEVENIKETLYEDGVLDMPGIGVLHYTIRGTFDFHPVEAGVLTPSLYGFDSFKMERLSEQTAEMEAVDEERPVVVQLPAAERKEWRLTPNWLGNAVAVAVAAILFFVLSVPVENTYIDKGAYASLGTDCLFDAIRQQSMAATLQTPSSQSRKQQALKPVTVRVEKVEKPAEPKVAAEPAKETPAVLPKAKPETKETAQPAVKKTPKPAAKETSKPAAKETAKPATKEVKAVQPKKHYHIIVSSLPTATDAKRMQQEYRGQGYKEAGILEGNGRFRISLCSYTDKSAAYRKLEELKQKGLFKGAWVLTAK